MALTGNAVKDTYLDLVQLEQSGAGLPSHAGQGAALYDGAGNRILARTGQPHWLDPHPDAASSSDTFEFGSMLDKNQATLEGEGWTFQNCTGKVENGVLELTCTVATTQCRAYRTVSLTGDFLFVAAVTMPFWKYNQCGSDTVLQYHGGFGFGDTVNDTIMYAIMSNSNSQRYNRNYTAGTWTGHGGGLGQQGLYPTEPSNMIYRNSGTFYLTAGAGPNNVPVDHSTANLNPTSHGWSTPTSSADANTYDRMAVLFSNTAPGVGDKVFCRYIRRFK